MPADLTSGNVVGLNPLQGFAALELARFISELPLEFQPSYNFGVKMAAIIKSEVLRKRTFTYEYEGVLA